MTTERDLIQRLADALEALQKEAVTTPHNQTIVVGGVAHRIPIGSDVLARDALHAHLLDRARAFLSQPEPEENWYPRFAHWLEQEMPEGTVIGDPLWWASKIADYLARWGRPAVEPVPVSERPWEREGWCDAKGQADG